jgi:hypothetical protein
VRRLARRRAADDSKTCVVARDEDQDDGCDPCPHQAGTTADIDGDGGGDACDPQPTSSKQRIAFFDTFIGLRTEWTGLSNISIEKGKIGYCREERTAKDRVMCRGAAKPVMSI